MYVDQVIFVEINRRAGVLVYRMVWPPYVYIPFG